MGVDQLAAGSGGSGTSSPLLVYDNIVTDDVTIPADDEALAYGPLSGTGSISGDGRLVVL